jgi:ABC-type Zn uptake system ZnuABC Zn-binding protein ZnuA
LTFITFKNIVLCIRMFNSHTRILIFGSLILLIVASVVLSLFIFFPKKNDSFIPTPKVVQNNFSSAISSVIVVDDYENKITQDVIKPPSTQNYIFVSLPLINYFVSKIADGGIEIIDLSQYGKGQIINNLSKNDFALIDRTKGLVIGESNLNQWIKDFYVDPAKKLDLKNDLDQKNSFWLSFRSLRASLQEIKDFLIKKDTVNKVIYEKNYERLMLKVDGIQEKYKKKLGVCSSKVLIEDGNSFADLAAEFGLKYTSVNSSKLLNLDTDKEESIRKVLLKNKSNTLFVVGDYSDADLNVMSSTLEGVEIVALSDFTINKNNIDYFDLLDRNLERLAVGLGCQ